MIKAKGFNRIKLSTKLLIITVIPLVLIILLVAVSFFVIRSMEDSAKLVDHTHEVLSNTSHIEKLVVDLETGERGFLITGKESFLEPFNRGKTTLAVNIETTKELVSDNPEQVKRMNEIGLLVNEWIEKAGSVEINARKQVKKGEKDADYLQHVLAKGEGKIILDNIRANLVALNSAFLKSNNIEAQKLAADVAKDIVDQETGQRGFLITGKDKFLVPFQDGQKSLKKNIEALNDLVDRAYDRQRMLIDIEQLKELALKWDQEIAQSAMKLRSEVNKGKFSHKKIQAMVSKAEGKKTLDSMRKILARMDKDFKRAHNQHGANVVLGLSKGIIDRETGLRGYLLAGNRAFLEPYKAGSASIKQKMIMLSKMVNNAYNIHKVRRRIADINGLAAGWLMKAARPEIAARIEMNKTKTTLRDVQELVEAETGKNIIDKLRGKLNAFSHVERNLMKQRKAESSLLVIVTNWTIILGTLLVIFLSLLSSFVLTRLIDRQLKKTGDVANSVASGNFDVEIELQNNEDYLGLALQKMTNALKRNKTDLAIEKLKLEEQDWIKGHQADLLASLQGLKTLPKLAEIVVNNLVPLLDAHLGLFYMKEESNESKKKKGVCYSLLSSYAYKKRKDISNTFALGEGLVGQSALEKKTILLTEAPKHYIEINSGSGKGAPRNIIVVPVVFEGETIAAIEIASAGKITEKHQTLLDVFSTNIGVIINNIISQQRTKSLLEKSEEMREELQTKQEELEQQTQVLKNNEEELKAQSDELKSSNEELEEKSDRLMSQNDDIEKKNLQVEEARAEVEKRAQDLALASKYKSEFLANMSHEFRTPLNSLLILSKELGSNKEGNLTDQQVEAAKVINEGGEDLLSLINDILDLSKVEAGKLQIHKASVDIKAWLNSLKAQFDPIVKHKGLAFVVDIASDVAESIETDGQRLSQIIKNLFFNAVKFTEKGQVTIKVSLPDKDLKLHDEDLIANGAIVFSIIDTGIGVPKDKQNEIFEAFQQGDGSTNRHYSGTGLGLAISRAMANLLGGEITFESEKGKGSIFMLVLPIKSSGIVDEKLVTSSTQKSGTDSGGDRRKNNKKPLLKSMTTNVEPRSFLPDDREKIKRKDKSILIIEDDPISSKALMDSAREKGYLCLAAGDGCSGIALAKKYIPKAIILDLGLPDVDGVQVLDQLKFELSTRHIPIHIISGREETPELRQKGAIGYLLKPATPEALASVFKKITSVTEDTVKNVLVVEDDPKGQLAIATLIDSDSVCLDQALTGQDAKDKIMSQPYDCVILDLDLPDFSGFDVLKQLKAEEAELPPVVVYTGRELSEEEHNELQKYASSIVLKGAESPERLLDEVS
jgi:signal transduction histidine kinase/CHASE3 domain sensor protein/DNA-binding response OmpR family regulator